MTETDLVPIIISTGAVLLVAVSAATGGLAMMLRSMNASMNRRFDDAQKANDQAHAQIGENINRVERQMDSGLNRVSMQLAAITPRAAAEKPDQETDR